MILFIFRHFEAARSAGFYQGKHAADPELRCWYPGDGYERLRGLKFSRIITVDCPQLTQRDVGEIRPYLRLPPATWIDL